VIGILDGGRNTFTLLQATAATGYVSVYAIPMGIALALLARATVDAWRRERLSERFVEAAGGAPRLVGMVIYVLLGVWFFAGVCLNSLRLLIYRSPSKAVVVLGTTIAVIVAMALLLVLSKPVIAVLASVLRRIEASKRMGWARSFFLPKRVAIQAGVVFVLLLAGGWFVSLRPRLTNIDLSFYQYVLGYAVLVFVLQAVWLSTHPLAHARTWLVASTAGVLLATSIGAIGTGYYVRHKRPYAMLEVWGNTVVAGVAVDRLFNIQLLRRDLRLPGLKPREIKGARHPNVVLITFDNIRADRTGFYRGGTKMQTMQRLRRDGVVFHWAIAAGTVTRRSLPSMVLGLSPKRVRGRVTGQALRLDPRHVLLAERFRAAGYETAGFLSPGMWFAENNNLGLVRGLDHLVVPRKANEHNGDWLVRRVREFIKGFRVIKPKKKLFLWVHFSDLNQWDQAYTAAEFGRKKRPRYDMAAEDVDRYLKFLLLDVWNIRAQANTLLAIAGDHGAALDETDAKRTSGPLGTLRLRVPLFIGGAGQRGKLVQQPVSTVDLAPTLLQLAGFEPPGMPHMDGKSFAKLVTSPPPKRRRSRQMLTQGEAYSVLVRDSSVPLSRRALTLGEYKLIEHDSHRADELYRYRRDPWERHNLTGKRPKIYKRLKARMEERRRIDRVSPF